MTEPARVLTPDEHKRGMELRDRCDALNLASHALDNVEWPNERDVESARREIEPLREDAHNALARFKREHGLCE